MSSIQLNIHLVKIKWINKTKKLSKKKLMTISSQTQKVKDKTERKKKLYSKLLSWRIHSEVIIVNVSKHKSNLEIAKKKKWQVYLTCSLYTIAKILWWNQKLHKTAKLAQLDAYKYIPISTSI